jgi:hypothetical protein
MVYSDTFQRKSKFTNFTIYKRLSDTDQRFEIFSKTACKIFKVRKNLYISYFNIHHKLMLSAQYILNE